MRIEWVLLTFEIRYFRQSSSFLPFLLLVSNLDKLNGRATRLPARLRGLALAALALTGLNAHAQQGKLRSFFADDAAARRASATSPLAQSLKASRPLTLDVAGLRTALRQAPLQDQQLAGLVVALPLPDGSTGRFRLVEAPVMAPALAAKFPEIKTYAGVGIDDPTATVRLDLTPQGFHAQVLAADGRTFYIDPTTRTQQTHYLSFWRSDMAERAFNCLTKNEHPAQRRAGKQAARTIGPTLRTVRLAVAADGEYTAFQGGTVAKAQAAIATTVNRVVGVYEKEMDIRMVLVANNSSLIYTNAKTDPYTNDDPEKLLDENQTTIDKVIGSDSYDIGHVFTTGGGGLSGLGVVCADGFKAQSETGSDSPTGDSYDIDFVAHEMGHEFGANHTFNGATIDSNGDGDNCANNLNPGTAYEPGSGTTIMAYAGVCSTANNIQTHSDAYFHVVSYEEIQTYLATTSCAVTSSTGNNPPTVRALPAGGKVLPVGTPFKLTASGYDSDGDALTYCWEEWDLGPAGSPTATQATGKTPPLFRSFTPSASPTRYFPRLSDIIGNKATKGERLPTVTRPLNFRVTLRDQHNGSQGVVGGLNSSDTLKLSITAAAGPFLVKTPNTKVTWAGGSSQTVTWDVAGTTANSVNCATVNVRLSTDGGLTYPTVLLAGTANDGSEAVTVPSVASTTARIMVEAADNYFFDISNANFVITTATACTAPTALSVGSIAATTASVSFTPSSSAASYMVTTSPATTTQTVTASPVSLTGLTAGTSYIVTVVSACANNGTSTGATATFSTTAPPACNEVANVALSNITGTSATLNFTATTTATNYTITTSPATTTQVITGTSASFTGLVPGTAYTVRIVSACPGGGQATTTATFGTLPNNDDCAGAISLTPAPTCTSTSGSVSGATQSQAPATCSDAGSTTANDVWYSFAATQTTHTVQLTSTFDGVLQVLSGTCGSLSSVSCVDTVGVGTEALALTSLTVGTRYYVRVYPFTENSVPVYGTFSVCVLGTAPTTPTACAAPTNVRVDSVRATAATLRFQPGSGATSYTITTTPATTTYTRSSAPVELKGLVPGTAYTVQVATNCASGTVAPVNVAFRSAVALASQPVLDATKVSIAPNPAHGSFRLTLPAIAGQHTVQATLLNVLGQAVSTRSIILTAAGATAEFSTRTLAQGVYVLRLEAGSQRLVQRVVVE